MVDSSPWWSSVIAAAVTAVATLAGVLLTRMSADRALTAEREHRDAERAAERVHDLEMLRLGKRWEKLWDERHDLYIQVQAWVREVHATIILAMDLDEETAIRGDGPPLAQPTRELLDRFYAFASKSLIEPFNSLAGKLARPENLFVFYSIEGDHDPQDYSMRPTSRDDLVQLESELANFEQQLRAELIIEDVDEHSLAASIDSENEVAQSARTKSPVSY
jgi:hypothetical protein